MSDTQEVLSELWLKALDNSSADRIEGDERFFECGGDSAAAIKLYMEAEEKLAVQIDPAEFMGTLADGSFDDLLRLAQASTGTGARSV